MGCVVFVVSSLASRVALFPMRLLHVSLGATVHVVLAFGADPARESLCV